MSVPQSSDFSGSLVGKSVRRKEAHDKVTGRSQYIDDMNFPGMLHGVTVRSQVARGRIQKISFEGNIPWHEFTVVTAKDIPGRNEVTLLTTDQPFLVDTVINHPEEPILLLAHPDKHLLEEARRSVRIEVEPLPAVFTIQDSLARKTIIWGQDNTFKSYLMEKGNPDPVWATAAHVIEGEYFTGAQEQLYIENNGMIAVASPEAGVTVWGSLQCPYYVHKALITLFDLPADKIRIIQAETGGGFGGKEEYPSLIAGHAALLAWKSGRPVKIIYDRAEDMACTTKRHPSHSRHRTAVSRDGKLLAMEIDFVIDGGAYNTVTPVVLSRGTIHGAGPYFCENIRIRAQAVATNTPPHGAFRGFGAPQSIFALERQMNKVAATVGLSPEEFRRRNFLVQGQASPTGQIIRETVDQSAILNRALKLADYQAKLEKFAAENPTSTVKRGIGFASFMHGAGFTGSGEKYLASEVGAEVTPAGKVILLAASTEIGQGTKTIFSQIAGDALGIDYDMIEVARPDTARVPNSGPTVASRTTMIVGKLVESVVIQLRQTLMQGGLLPEKFTKSQWTEACAAHIEKFGTLRATSQYKQPPNINWDDTKYQGDAYGAYAWATYVAQVAVDTITYETRVEDFVALQEVGKVINPILAEGQIEGGVAQGIGYAIYENVLYKDGRMINNQMTNYIMPTAADLPPIRVFFEELPYAYGPFGAKGIGELPLDGPAPAILNAIENAIGRPVDRVPLLPEGLMKILGGSSSHAH